MRYTLVLTLAAALGSGCSKPATPTPAAPASGGAQAPSADEEVVRFELKNFDS